MATLKVSISLPDETHADLQLRLSANDSDCDVLIALPLQRRELAQARGSEASVADDDYVLGGYAGI